MTLSHFAATLVLALILATSVSSGRAEIVERQLGTDSAGNPVTGFVLQGGRSSRRSSRDSGLSDRRSTHARHSDYRYFSPYSGYGCPAWHVPVPIIPMHCGSPARVWHGWSVTIVR